jgi:peptidoglycan/xylan/chitin deacetylase (PgdA/CDA1 family)
MYLTFDDGPTPGHTATILEALSTFGAQATFFLTTERVAENEAVVRKIAEAGHVIGIHGHAHDDPWLRKASGVWADLERSLLILRGLLGTEIDWVRPAYGHVRATTFRFAREHDLLIAGWDVMPGDFVKGVDARLVFRRIASGVRSGSIVVLHDNDRVRESAVTLDALEMTLRYFADRGWRFDALPRGAQFAVGASPTL